MKTLLTLLLAGLIVLACVRAGDSAWRHYQLEDAVEQEARFSNGTTTSQLRKRVVELAENYGVTLAPEAIAVERRGTDTHVSFAYTEQIPLVPRAYIHDQVYEVTLNVRPLRPLVDDNPK